jgi:DNA-binding NarL/FixJ family response regulator
MPATAAEPARVARRTILLVDDHPLIRLGLATLIGAEPDLAVSATVESPAAALAAIAKSPPDLMIVDIGLRNADGLQLIADLKARHLQTKVLVLSMHEESLYAVRALRAGAEGYVCKREPGEILLAAIRCVLAGETWMSAALRQELAAKYVSGRTMENDSPLAALTSRELSVFRLIGEGRTTRQIAEILGRSIKTVESHIEHIKGKLTIGSAAELAQRATQWVESGRLS